MNSKTDKSWSSGLQGSRWVSQYTPGSPKWDPECSRWNHQVFKITAWMQNQRNHPGTTHA